MTGRCNHVDARRPSESQIVGALDRRGLLPIGRKGCTQRFAGFRHEYSVTLAGSYLALSATPRGIDLDAPIDWRPRLGSARVCRSALPGL
jgi:hypothetical protein